MDKLHIYIISFILLLIFSVVTVMNSSYFEIEEIKIEGNRLLSKQEIINICRINKKQNIFDINRARLVKRLMRLSQVKGVKIHRDLPRKLLITINERRPVAIVEGNPSYQIIDVQGWILETTKNLEKWNIPLIKGIKVKNKGKTVKLTGAFKGSVEYLGLLPEMVLEQISQVNIYSPQEIELFLSNNGKVKLGRMYNIDKKAKILTSIYQDIQKRNLKIKYIDLRYQRAPVVKLRE